MKNWHLLVVIGIIFIVAGISLAVAVISVNALTSYFQADELLEQQLLGASIIIALLSLLWMFLAVLYRATEQATK